MRKLRAAHIFIIQLTIVFTTMAQADFTADVTSGCTPLEVIFSIDESTVDMDTITRIDWDYGDGDSITTSELVTYLEEGQYSVEMIINGNSDNSVVKTNYITVHRTVQSIFRAEEYESENNFRFIPLDEITDPDASYSYLWRYTKSGDSNIRSNSYFVNYLNQENAIDSVTLDTGVYNVELILDDSYGCLSRFDTTVVISTNIQIPNVYAPASGEFFTIDPQNINTVLKFDVFNRYGLNVFSQSAPLIVWDGRSNNGTELNTGVYFYTLETIGGDPVRNYVPQGFIHLYR